MANNPAEIAIQEAKALFPGRRINCVVSLGTGEAAQKPAGKGITDALKQIVLAATSSQIINSRAKYVCKRDGIPFTASTSYVAPTLSSFFCFRLGVKPGM